MTIRIAFAGTPDFAAHVLKGLIAENERAGDLDIAAVFSQPARRKGRGLKVAASPVENLARECEFPFYSPEKWTETESRVLSEIGVDYLVTAAYGLILPEHALAAPRLAPVNVHTSLLPRWRGAAPIQRAIEAGDQETGSSIFVIEKSLDTGPVIGQSSLAIGPHETSIELHDRLAEMSVKMLPDTLREHFEGRRMEVPQDHSKATYAEKISKEEGRLTWEMPAKKLYRKFRAFQPWPGVWIGGVKLGDIRPVKGVRDTPGVIVSLDPLIVALDTNGLEIRRLQKSGSRMMAARDFLKGHQFHCGDRLEIKGPE